MCTAEKFVLAGTRSLCCNVAQQINYRNELPYFPDNKTHFFPKKCDLNSTCVLCAEGKYYFQTYKYPYILYITSLSWDSENNHEDDFSGSDDNLLGFYDE